MGWLRDCATAGEPSCNGVSHEQLKQAARMRYRARSTVNSASRKSVGRTGLSTRGVAGASGYTSAASAYAVQKIKGILCRFSDSARRNDKVPLKLISRMAQSKAVSEIAARACSKL